MSYKTTDVSLNNNKKRNSELLGDPMICGDASRTDCDVDESKKQNNTNILKNKSEIPPKNDTPNSEVLITCEPPKSKKRKLSSFDELLHNLDYCVLYTNLTKLQFFLESDNNKCIFLLTKDYEEFFEMIVQDINILKSKSLDDDYRHISNKIIKAAAGKLLFYVFENKPEFLRKVMVIKKVHIMDQSGNSAASISWSDEGIMPPSPTSPEVDTNDQSRSLFPAAITSGFKTHCLRTMLVFIKNDAIKTKEFPELNTEQAKFMQLLLGKVNIDNFDSNSEVTELYRALVHAVRINELKYEFRIKCDETWGGKKSVVFEKVPVLIPSGTAVDSDQTAGTSKQNPKTNVQNTEDPKSDTPKPDASKPEFSQSVAPKSHGSKKDVLKPDITKSNGPNIDVPKTDGPESHGPKKDVLKQDASKWQDPKMDVPQTEAPESHGPKIDVLKPNAHKSNGPNIDVLKTDGPESHGPKKDVLKQDASKWQDPKMDVPQTDAPESHGPKKDVLKQDSSKSQDPKMDVPKPDAPESHGPKIDVPQTEAPESHGPKIDVLKPDAPKSNGLKIGVLKPDALESQDPKMDVPQTEAPESHGPKIDVLKPDAPKSNGLKIGVLKPDALESQDPKMDVPQTEAPESHGPKIDVLKPDAPKSNGLKIGVLKPDALESQDLKMDVQKIDAPKSQTTKIEPQPDVAEPWFEKPKPLIRTRRQIKHENQKLFLKNTPKKFIEDALNTILDFLSNDDMEKLVLVPKTPSELKFFRKCIPLCKSSVNLSQFGEEFRELHSRISRLMSRIKVDVTRKGLNAFNEITGIREVTYVKIPKNYISGTVACTEAKETSDGGEWESTPKKPKVNVQKALQLAATDNIKLDKVINLNQSLRSKKKDKKRKKAELKKAKKSKGASSSSSTSRDSSRDRVKAAMAAAFVPPGPKVAKRPSSEISPSPKNTFPNRPSVNTLRNVKLREAMSVPVQSDKAMRMMLGMGWNGGALGPRGDGITEPLMPALEIPRGAGFGLISHRTKTQNANPDSVPLPKKPKEPNPPAPVVPGTDIVVEKTKQLLLEDVTFDTVMNTTEPEQNNVLPSKPSKSTVGLQKRNVGPSKQTTSKELPTQTRFSIESQKEGNADLKLRLPFRMEILHSIWDLINSDASCKSLKFDERLNKKQRKFVTFAMQTLGGKKDNIRCMFSLEEIPICKQIRNKYMETQITVEARYFWDYKSIDLLKLPKKFNQPTPIVFENIENTATITNCNQIINSESLQSYILSTNGGTRDTLKTIKNMRFKVLFLMNMLKFVKSLYEEYEVTFNKVLNAKEKLYMENVVDQINMRIKFGSSPAETKIGDQIREHVKDAFLGIMYDHEHTIITLSKYYRFKRLNRPDNAVRRKTQATVNLDDFTSETLIEPKLKTEETFNREIHYGDGEDKYKVSEDKFEVSEHTNEVTETDNTQVSTENTTANVSDDETSEALPNSAELGPYDSDDSSVEEYNDNNANVKVPKLLPGEEGVNISNFLYLYDKDKTNTAGIRDNSITNNDSASNVTENRNSKNNSGNGNVVIDNNDNQFIDMKRAGGNAQDTQKENNVDWEKAEYVMCVDYKEEVILNTEDLDPNIVVIEDSDSDNDCTENKAKDKIKNITENLPLEDFKGETDVIIKDIDAVKTMKILNITEDLMEGINTEPVHGIVKDDSNAVIKKDESRTVINIDNSNAKVNLDDAMDVKQDKTKVAIIQGESMIVFNSVESSKDKKVAQIKEGTSISPRDENIVKDNLVIKSDCDRIKKDDIGLSEEFCNTQPVKSICVQTVGAGTDFLHDKDSEIKNVRIGHTHHPIRKLGTAKVEKIQWHISNCIKLATELPLLKCHGVQNGALFYTCHNKKTYDWLQNTIGVASYVKVFDTEEITKMALKLCGYFDFDSNYLFKMLEMYNKEISTKEWVVEKTEKNGDYIIFIVKMDQFSIKFIQESDLALFAGIDKVHFSPIWE